MTPSHGPCGGLKLSPREGEVLAMMNEGLRVHEIAQRLEINPSTVVTYRKRALEKGEEPKRPILGEVRLTRTQQRVLDGLLRGKNAIEIASDIHRSEFTVHSQVRRIREMLGIAQRSSHSELFAWAARSGLVWYHASLGPSSNDGADLRRRIQASIPRRK